MRLQVAKNAGRRGPLGLVHSYATISSALSVMSRTQNVRKPLRHSGRYIPNMPSSTLRLSFGGVAMVRFSEAAIDMYQLRYLGELEQHEVLPMPFRTPSWEAH
jgi:hypothetical protein